ncbi:beta-mannosidase [Vibrio maerlii]|uniref:beta-mannosidase n=1 Tax=Vibrio maerlii TaxID=2231648 RepID=UPI000E3D6D8E|nr:glycoside hydrolase family 2 protein [Vibrio maerlii]
MTVLNGEWTLTSKQRPEINISMMIPGDNYNALLKAGMIENPYYGCNEHDVQWVRECDWQIERTFVVEPEQLSCNQLVVSFTRLDTVASVYVNEELVLSASNMFQKHQVDIKSFVKAGENSMRIEFAQAIAEAKRRADQLPFPIPSSMGDNNQVPHMNILRKTQCHTGWDWGICLPVSGIYDPIIVEEVGDVRLNYVTTEQIWAEDGSVELVLNIDHSKGVEQEVVAHFNGHTQQAACVTHGSTVIRFMVENPKLWWPAGYGDQPLYDLKVELAGQTVEKRIGLRHLELNTEADDIGSAMEFRVNGFPITAKGANWIPIDAMPSLESEERYRALLTSAKEANMNMIRVWGGGHYESETFYNTCDELGLLVWQDMMFSCALYPSTPEFIADVEPEIAQQIRRLKDHACIAIWCGDNEVIGALNWYDESKNQRDKYTVNYDRLNRRLSEVIQGEDTTRTFWPSSPCNGDLDYGDAWHDDNRGDMHFWDVWHSGSSFKAYLDIQPRFCSEFGFQSWPSFSEVKSFVPEQDWNVTSPTFESHQKNGSGNSIITEMFTRYFRFPANFEQMLYLSQVQQSVAIKTGCEYWRSIGPTCRGMLYWQLNDCWPVSSWSSLEYSGRWKQLHYHAKRFFAPTYLPFVETEDALTVRVSNNRREVKAVNAKIVQSTWSGEILNSWDINVEAKPDDNQEIWTLEKAQWHSTAQDYFFYVEADVEGEYIQNTWFSTPEVKGLPLEKANVSVEVNGDTLTFTTDKPAFYVHVEFDGDGRFSDSSFTLLPNQRKEVKYIGDQLDELANSLRVYHLTNSY